MARPIRPILLAAGLGLLAFCAAPAGAAVRPCTTAEQAAATPCQQPAQTPCATAPCR